MKPWLMLTVAMMLTMSASAQISASENVHSHIHRTDDVYAFGGTVRSDKPVDGDMISAGGRVEAMAPIEGDLIAAGGDVRIVGPVGQDVFAAGGRVALAAPVAGDVSIAGGQVVIESDARISGDLSAAGGEVRIDGPVDGDVDVTAGSITLGPNARIGGKFTYRSENGLLRDPSAQVLGVVVPLPRHPRHAALEEHHTAGGLWSAGLITLAALLVYALPGPYTRVSAVAASRPGICVLLGFAALLCIPIASVLIMITLIGIPIGLLALMLYPALLIAGYVGTAIALGDRALGAWNATRAQAPLWRAGAAALAMLLIRLLATIPVLGGWLSFMALLAGSGALLLQWRYRKPAAPALS